MKGLEMTESLIDDIKKIIRAQKYARTREQLHIDIQSLNPDPNDKSNTYTEENSISFIYDTIPIHLKNLISYFDFIESYIDYNKDGKINVVHFSELLVEYKQQIIDALQKIKDNDNLIIHNEPLYNRVKRLLDYIHQEAEVSDNCLNIIVKKKNLQI
jgi:hypothetical protein